MSGVIIGFYSSIEIPREFIYIGWIFLMFITFLKTVSRYARRFLGGFWSLFFMFFGVYLVAFNSDSLSSGYFANQINKNDVNYFQVELIKPPEEKENSIKVYAVVKTANQMPSVGETLLYFEKTNQAKRLSYGDVIYLKTNFNSIKANGNPKEFDYARYLKIHNIFHQGYVREKDWIKIGNSGSTFFKNIYKTRFYLEKCLDKSGLSGQNLMIAKALILGAKEELDRSTLRTFSSAGAMHVLAVSGLHVGIIMLIFSFLLKPIKLLKGGKLWFVVIILIVIWTYALITGMSSSVLRASVMFSFVVIGKEIQRDTSIYQSILVSAFLLILIEPLVIFQVGFQLSYLAVLGIVFLQPKIYNLVYTKYFLLDKVWQITSVSIAAQLATFPLGLFYFHQFPNFFFVSNLIVIPLAFFILIVGITYFFLHWVPFIEAFLFFCLNGLITILNIGVKWIEALPYSIYWGVSIHWFETFWLYLTLLFLTGAFAWKRKKLLFTGVFLLICFLLFNFVENNQLERERELVIYNVKNEIAIDVFEGRENLFLANKKLLHDEEKLLFHVKHNWFYKTGNEKASFEIEYDENINSITFQNETVLFLLNDQFFKTNTVNNIPSSTLIYLYDLSFIDKKVIHFFNRKEAQLILGDGISYGAKKLIYKTIPASRIHQLSVDGAFKHNLN